MKTMNAMLMFAAAAALLSGCGRLSTPSMMNTSQPRVVEQTTLEEMPVGKVSDGYLHKIASDYGRYGTDRVHLALAYDPASKTYDAMQAFKDLSRFKERLGELGVHGINAETVKVSGGTPTLMVSYQSASALAPAGCRSMPGMDDGLTTAQIGDYRFGCSVDTLIAQQIYRPTDLKGRGDTDAGDGRRAANSTEFYRRVEQAEAESELNRIQRTDISGQ